MFNRKNRFEEEEEEISQLKCMKNKYELVLTALVYLAGRRKARRLDI